MRRRDALRLVGGALALTTPGCGSDVLPVIKWCSSPSAVTRFGSVIYGADDIDEALGLIAGCGGRLVRIGLDGVSGVSLERADAVLAKAARHGLRAILISPYHPQPVDAASYAADCAAIHRRYAQHDPIWEIWNEPNLANYWGAEPNVNDYASVAIAAATALRTNGATQVWTGGTSGVDLGWIAALKRLGMFRVFNGCAVHSYKAPSAALTEYMFLRNLLNGVPIHTTETCVASSLADQSAFLRGMWYVHRMLGLTTLVWCELRDFTAGTNPPYNLPYGLLWSTYRPKDVYNVAKQLTSACDYAEDLRPL